MLDYDAIGAASSRLDGVAHRTPVVTSRQLDDAVGAPVLCKVEAVQRTGSFKFRGAYNAVARLDPAELERGVATASSGNHGQALALAAQLLGTTAVVVMPHDAPAVKVAAVEGYGATVVRYHRYDEDRDAVMRAVAEEQGRVLIPPYDHVDVMAGQGTATLELVEDHPGVTTIVVPVGGGGLLAGSSTVAAHHGLDVWGVEPAAGDDHVRSAAAGSRVRLDEVPDTIADGQQVQMPGELTWPVNVANGVQFVSVDDEAIVDAMRFAFERLKLVLEPSGACALSAVLSGACGALDGPVGVVLSGGNVDRGRYASLLGGS